MKITSEKAIKLFSTGRFKAIIKKVGERRMMIGIERDRLKAEREAKAERSNLFSGPSAGNGDLWAVGLELVWKMIK